jgi:hypothetical protein
VSGRSRRAASGRDRHARFELFSQKVDELLLRRAIRENTVDSGFSLSFRHDPETDQPNSALEFQVGDEEDFRSLLVAFRPFVSESEDVFCNRIHNDLLQVITDDAELRADAETAKADWRTTLRGPIQFYVNETPYTALKAFDLVINGELFHSDEQKAAQFANMPSFMQEFLRDAIRTMVLDGLFVLDATRITVDAVLVSDIAL